MYSSVGATDGSLDFMTQQQWEEKPRTGVNSSLSNGRSESDYLTANSSPGNLIVGNDLFWLKGFQNVRTYRVRQKLKSKVAETRRHETVSRNL